MYFLAKLLSGCAMRSVGELLYKQVIKRGRRDTIIAGANYSAPSRDFPISHLPPKQDVPLYGSTFPCECNTLSEHRSSPAEAAAGEGQPSAPPTPHHSLRGIRLERAKQQKANKIIFLFDFRIWPLLPPTGTANSRANSDCQVCVSANNCFVSATKRQ